MENLLEKLFESVPKVRLLRLFMRNPEEEFTLADIISRSQIRSRTVRPELNKLMKIGLIQKKKSTIQYEIKKKPRKQGAPKKIVLKSKKTQVYFVNQNFELLSELRDLATRSSVASRKKLLQKIKGVGKIKLAIISGIFLNNDNSRTDMLIVGDGIKRSRLDNFLGIMESELGKPLRYTLMDTKEFKYRLDMYDRFLRDILEFPHDKLINKLHI